MRERSFGSFEPKFAAPNRSHPQVTLTCSASCWLAAMLIQMSMGYLRGLMGRVKNKGHAQNTFISGYLNNPSNRAPTNEEKLEVLLSPFWAGAAHIVQLRPIGVE
jgi:hypothetical protein